MLDLVISRKFPKIQVHYYTKYIAINYSKHQCVIIQMAIARDSENKINHFVVLSILTIMTSQIVFRASRRVSLLVEVKSV